METFWWVWERFKEGGLSRQGVMLEARVRGPPIGKLGELP